jgi:hypothetical protein
MATKHGARASGIDAAEALLAIARERVIDSNFRTGEMEVLPCANRAFDIQGGHGRESSQEQLPLHGRTSMIFAYCRLRGESYEDHR